MVGHLTKKECSEKSLGLEKSLRLSVLDDLTLIHNQYPLSLLDFRPVVGNKNHGFSNGLFSQASEKPIGGVSVQF